MISVWLSRWIENQSQQEWADRHAAPPAPDPDEDIEAGIPLPDEPLAEPEPEAAPLPPSDPEPKVIPQAQSPDDLKRIEGIGPKIAATLNAAGVTSFAQLAALEAPAIKQILVDGGVRIGFPATWPEQAALAARGDWEALARFQAALKGGRRVD